MRRMTGLVLASLLVSTGLLCGCNDDEYVPGEGARRYGAVRDIVLADAGGGAVEIGEAAAAPVPAVKKKQPGKAPKPDRGSRKKRGGKGTKYAVIAGGVKDGGAVSGTITLAGEGPPGLKMIPITKDLEKCGHKEHPSERVVMDESTRGLANCVVVIENITKGKDWPETMRAKDRKILIDQKACKYIPHVLVCREKTQLEIANSDPAEHNIHGYYKSMANTVFNIYTAVGAAPATPGDAFLKKPGKYLVKCDIHPWMNAYVHAVTNPYFAVTDEKGKFEIKDVPPGKYKLWVWHESMKEEPQYVAGEIAGYNYGPDWTTTKSIEVAAGATVTADFTVPLP